MLNGWTDETETEFMEGFWLKCVAGATDKAHKANMQTTVDRIRAWVDKHPEGIERDRTTA